MPASTSQRRTKPKVRRNSDVIDATYACADWPTQVKISIHASRMGCDTLDIARRAVTYRDFNPRLPYGMRQRSFDFRCVIIAFQSTHPVWDATVPMVALLDELIISIHASRMGCDRTLR